MPNKAGRHSAKPGARLWVRDHDTWKAVTVTAVTNTPKGLKVSWVDEQGQPGRSLAAQLYLNPPPPKPWERP
jgi:hypothetical protein